MSVWVVGNIELYRFFKGVVEGIDTFHIRPQHIVLHLAAPETAWPWVNPEGLSPKAIFVEVNNYPGLTFRDAMEFFEKVRNHGDIPGTKLFLVCYFDDFTPVYSKITQMNKLEVLILSGEGETEANKLRIEKFFRSHVLKQELARR